MGNDIAKTRLGTFEGLDLGHCISFRGIPYASPPVGKLRFRPAEPPAPTKGTYDAKKFRNSCLQPGSETFPQFPQTGPTEMSEDCLYLNIWTPSPDARARPVMVWIHGGAFVFGSGAFPWYDGAKLTTYDVVVVTINYRLGPFGFLHLPALLGERYAECTNLGLKDQIAALTWIRDHIEDFGGDPENVTLFGESAGGMSVGTLLGTPSAKGLFGKAIAQSGAAHNVLPPDLAAMVAEKFGASFESATGRSPKSAAAIFQAPAEAILDAGTATVAAFNDSAIDDEQPDGYSDILLPFQPAIDGAFLPNRPIDEIRRGTSAGVPLVTGTTKDEYMLFTFADKGFPALDQNKVIRRIQRVISTARRLGYHSASRSDTAHTDPEEIYDAYAAHLEAGGRPSAPKYVWAAVATDVMFKIPAVRLADAQASHSPTRAYYFTWESPMAGGMLGACHAIDIPFVFSNIDNPLAQLLCGEGPEVSELSNEIGTCWTKFATDGDPESPLLGRWPLYDPSSSDGSGRVVAEFGQEVRVTTDEASQKLRLWDGVL
jgi:para-nitrobenzyl esterase